MVKGVVAIDGLPVFPDTETSLMAGTPKLQVVSIAPARYFVMFDQPQMLAEALRAYLTSL